MHARGLIAGIEGTLRANTNQTVLLNRYIPATRSWITGKEATDLCGLGKCSWAAHSPSRQSLIHQTGGTSKACSVRVSSKTGKILTYDVSSPGTHTLERLKSGSDVVSQHGHAICFSFSHNFSRQIPRTKALRPIVSFIYVLVLLRCENKEVNMLSTNW